MRNHDAQKAQELVYEGDIQAGFCVWRRNLAGYLAIPKSRCPRRVEKEASMCIESHGSGGIDLDFCC